MCLSPSSKKRVYEQVTIDNKSWELVLQVYVKSSYANVDGILFAINTQLGFTKREKKRSLLKSLKILYVKKMSQRQKGMQNSLGKPPHC
ncbi:hypothetical protein P8452_01505 [Trifolium repens]|nr:hypothetical protein P8452_01505 [Trifolium repens]